MADPVLDEDMILSLLQSPPGSSPDALARLQAGSLQALCDMYDRKSTRDAFGQGASAAVALYGQTCKLWMLMNIKDAFNNGDLDIARFMEAEHGLLELIRKQSLTVAEIVSMLKACPTSQDSIH